MSTADEWRWIRLKYQMLLYNQLDRCLSTYLPFPSRSHRRECKQQVMPVTRFVERSRWVLVPTLVVIRYIVEMWLCFLSLANGERKDAWVCWMLRKMPQERLAMLSYAILQCWKQILVRTDEKSKSIMLNMANAEYLSCRCLIRDLLGSSIGDATVIIRLLAVHQGLVQAFKLKAFE